MKDRKRGRGIWGGYQSRPFYPFSLSLLSALLTFAISPLLPFCLPCPISFFLPIFLAFAPFVIQGGDKDGDKWETIKI